MAVLTEQGERQTMKPSKFNILITPSEDKSKTILYNTLYDHRLIIENETTHLEDLFDKLKQGLSLSTEENEIAETLKSLGILLDDTIDERQFFDNWYETRVQNNDGTLHVLLTISMACNLRCPYCFEKDQLDAGKQMTMDMANHFIQWVKTEITSKQLQDVSIIYFGGEPLMNQKILFHISSSLQKMCQEFGISYHGSMISNGALMTPAISEKLRAVGIQWVKVTLDGDKHTHDLSRITANGKGSFDAIYDNLSKANLNLKENESPIRFRIGGNFSDLTYPGFQDLLDKLETAPFREYIDQINLKPVQDVSLTEPESHEGHSCHTSSFDKKNTERIMKLRKVMHEKELPAVDGLNLGPCDFYRGDSISIGIDGTIYPCSAFLDNEKYAIGNITQQSTSGNHSNNQSRWTKVKPWTPECYDCSFLPVCTGGCRATAYSQGYSWDATVCEKSYFKRIAKVMAYEMLGLETEVFDEPTVRAALSTESQQSFSV